jgi:nucleotide-binding universal stress UspA family protein
MSARIEEIMVPVDGSDSAVRAARFALEMAAAMGASVRLFYVMPAASVELVGMAGMGRADIEQLGKSSGERVFKRIREELGVGPGEKLEEAVALGEPAEEILAYAAQHPASLVVMGRRGLSRMQSLMLGSVSDKVLRHARCPVTVVS